MTDSSQYAIVLHSVVPVRTQPDEGAEQSTQLLFGEICRVIQSLPRWYEVVNLNDNEQGYVDFKMVTPLSADEYQSYAQAYKQSQARVRLPLTYAVSENNGQTIPICFGTLLPHYTEGGFDLLGVHFRIDEQAVCTAPLEMTEQNLMQVTRFLLNTPYLWGGKNALGMDCSGFTQTVMSLFGYLLPRNARQQIAHGQSVADVAHIQAGDLLFFDHNDLSSEQCEANNCKGDERITHVGIAIDSQRVIHCSGRVKIEPLDARGIFSPQMQAYTHHLAGIRRMGLQK